MTFQPFSDSPQLRTPSPDESVSIIQPGTESAPAPLPQRIPSNPISPGSIFDASPRAAIQDMIYGVLRFAAVHAFVCFRGPEHLAESGEMTSDELAARCGADPAAMRQLLSALHAYAIVTARGGRYRLTKIGRVLLPDAEDSMYAAVKVNGAPLWWNAAGTLQQTIRTGHPAVLDGAATLYDRLSEEPELAAQFDQFMSDRSDAVGRDLAGMEDHYFTGAHTVADLGGGRGGVLAAILQAHPRLQGMLVERADVASRAMEHLAEQGLASRTKLVVGDIFSTAYPGAQRVILSSVLHNWPDANCLTLLKLIRVAMQQTSQDAELWCIEGVKPEQEGQYSPCIDLGIRMMAMFPGGQERTWPQFQALMTVAGLRIRETLDLSHGQTLMIATLAETGS